MIENADMDPAEQERRKKQQIEWRTKKRNSSIFTFCATVAEIIISLAIVLILFALTIVILSAIFQGENQETASTIYGILCIIDLIAGLYLGVVLYKKIARWVIRKFNLQDKLLDSLLNHYKTVKELKEEQQNKHMN